MNKLILAVAAVASIAVADSRADWGTPPRPSPDAGTQGPATSSAGQFGWNPILKKVFWWKKKDDCGTGGCAGGNCAGQGAAAGGPPPFQGGTLVFPNHQFARSPRDYFMYGHGGN